jgi:hypothetical protein
MGTSIKTANPNVSNAILKALGNDARGKPQISNTEFNAIKKAAVAEVKHSDNPTRTLSNIKSSFELANRVTGGDYKSKFGELVKNDLSAAVDARKTALRQVNTNNWGGNSGGSSGRTYPS